MGTLFKAAIGFGIAFYIWSPAAFSAHFDPSAVASLRGQIESAHPHDKLMARFADLKR